MGLLLLLTETDGATASPTVTTHPSSLTAYEYLTATFSVTATGGALSYQWQKSDNAGVDWSNVSGATSSSYTTGALTRAADNSDQYRCVVTNSLGTANSNAATLTVWSPAALTGLQLWLDAADASTVLEGVADTAEDGDLITQWSDRSGNSRHATASGTGRPTYRATGQNGRGSIEFDGSTDFLSVGTTGTFNFLHNGTDSLAVAVFKAGTVSDPNAVYAILSNNGGSSAKIGYSLFFDDRASVPRNNGIGTLATRGVSGDGTFDNYQSDMVLANQYNIIIDRIRANDGTALARSLVYPNGNMGLIGNNTLSFTASASNHSDTTCIGKFSAGSGFLSGDLVELILCNNPNTSSWTDLLRYLSQKWDITIDDVTYSSLQRISGAVSSYDAFPTIYDTGTALVTLFRSASSHVGTKGTISSSVSTDSGVNWTPTLSVISDATFDLRDPHGMALDNGDLLIACNLYNFSTSSATGAGVYRSTDDGATFSSVATVSPRSGYDFWFPCGKMVKIGSTIYAPIYERRTSDAEQFNTIWKTTDEGVTWTLHSTISSDYNETAIINTGGTNWLAVARATVEASNPMAWFTSSDDMATWSSANLTNFGVQAVSPYLIRWDDDIWLFIGDRSGTSGIKTWKWTGSGWTHGVMVYVAAGTDCGYPSAVIDSSNRMHLVFYHQYTSPGIQHYRITKN